MKKIVWISILMLFTSSGVSYAGYGVTARAGGLGLGQLRDGGEQVNGLFLNYWWSKDPLNEINGVALGFAPRAYRMNGITLGLINPTAEADLTGLGVNLATGARRLTGVFVNASIAVVNESARGIVIGGWAVEARKLTGFSAGGISGVWTGEMTGVGIGSATVSRRTVGLSAGIVNYSIETRGVQIGLLNFCENLYGVQIGALNFAGNNPRGLRYLPLLNLHLPF